MTCFKCDGTLCQDRMHDLPRKLHEYFCVNCGERFWVDTNTLTFDVRPLTRSALQAVHHN